MIVDAHIHLYEYDDNVLKKWEKDFIFIAVSDDIASSIKTLRLSILYKNVIPAVGIHPWNISSENDVSRVLDLVEKYKIKVLGEVGLDRRFSRKNYDIQLKFFTRLLEVARDYNLSLNIHCLDCWDVILNLLEKYDISSAYFHWYTGPIRLVRKIEDLGYFIGINPAIMIQKKQQEILKEAKIEHILTESDGPYNYRGLELSPNLIRKSLEIISKYKDIDTRDLEKILQKNLSKFLSG